MSEPKVGDLVWEIDLGWSKIKTIVDNPETERYFHFENGTQAWESDCLTWERIQTIPPPSSYFEKLDSSKKRLEEAEAALAFYSNKENWKPGHGMEPDSIISSDYSHAQVCGGKRAREYFEKWGEK